MELTKRICANCGDVFYSYHPTQKYCRQVKLRVCPICGKEFEQRCEGQISSVCSDPNCIKRSQSFYKPKNKKKCKICGELFLPSSSRQSYCGNIHFRTCKICNSQFEYRCEANSDPDTCYDCRGRKYIKICKICGKKFISTSPSKQICDDVHYETCLDCGKKFVIPNDRAYEHKQYCSDCSNKHRIEKIKLGQSKLPENWNRSKSEYIKKCKYCGKTFTTNAYNQVYCDGPHYAICSVCGDKFIVDNIQLFNRTSVCSTRCKTILARRTKISDPSIYLQWEIFESNPQKWIYDHYGDNKPSYATLVSDLHMAASTIQQLLAKLQCEDCVSHYVSKMESEVTNFIQTQIGSNIQIVHNDRQQIKPKELDLYLPEYHLAVECNPTISHNSTIPFYDQSGPMESNYHRMKTDMCEKAGIQLFHIFGYEWTNKRKIIESMIRNMLRKNQVKIGARQCIIKEVDYDESALFLNENHRQGNAVSSYRIGLYYNGELVSLMTFSRPRKSISNNDAEYELVRFCNKLNTTVMGGASKLFRYFVTKYSPFSILSYSDRAHASGRMYSTLGFKELRRTDPGYVWVDTITDTAYNRINTQKHNIRKFLKDDSIDLSRTEKQIMEEHGYVQVFDSGNILWKWTNIV